MSRPTDPMWKVSWPVTREREREKCPDQVTRLGKSVCPLKIGFLFSFPEQIFVDVFVQTLLLVVGSVCLFQRQYLHI